MANDPVLVHVCCAPCLCAMLEPLQPRAASFTALFENPNIHPLIEFRRRLKAVHVLADQVRFPLLVEDAYGLNAFLDAVGAQRERPARCRACYALRLEAGARRAAESGFPVFTSTLLVSPQQDRDVICELGHAAGRRHGVGFDDTDHRGRHGLGLEEARRRQLYRQQYCGCVFSEYDRYCTTTTHLYQPPRQAGR